jgi:5'-3' exonuclease
MRALIDADILLYRIGFVTEDATEEDAKLAIDELIHRILEKVQATEYRMFLSCSTADNFRTALYPKYKADRKPKPKHYQILKDHLLDSWQGEIGDGEEADDLIGINSNDNSIACTIDKDILYGLEGHKYNFVKDIIFYTSQEDATRFFYKQILMGDGVDNIIGLPNIGDKKSSRMLEGLETEEEMFDKVLSEYLSHGFTEEQLLINGQLLKIRTREGELWQFPIGQRQD